MRRNRNTPKNVVDRFWAMVDKSGDCWIWTGSIRETGYGQFNNSGKIAKAHRVSYEWAYGAIPSGLDVCHTCDNRRCVRPDHLFVGTRKENMQDCVRKGRQRRVPVKLTWDAVREMRRLYAAGGHSMQRLADQFNISHSTVASIIQHRMWKEG